jgi:protein-S-isoprenylcysteine O-methyltransferase Ste14
MLFVIGMMLYWPTLITIPMACILCFAYYRLAINEERVLAKMFESQYNDYSLKVPRFLGRNTLKIFRLPKKLSLDEFIVVTAFLIPFILWFAEAVAGVLLGTSLIRAYWFPIAYALPAHIGVIISLFLLLTAGIVALVKWKYPQKQEN